MKVVALVSGGKDSCYAIMKCIDYGHKIAALANLMPADDLVDELDSYMYQTVGHQIVVSYAKCMGVPLFRRRIQGSTRHQDLGYKFTPGDEVEDMFILLNEVTRCIPSITAVSSGAIASDYQRLRVESVCSRLGLVSLAYLWKQDQSLLLQAMVANGIKAMIVKVAAIGLDPAKHLGKDIEFMSPCLHKLKELYGINICGEGGEYETLTLDCPLFINARIKVNDFKIVLHSSDSIAPVGVLHPLDFYLEKEDRFESSTLGDTTDDGRITSVVYTGRNDSVIEVLGDCLEKCEAKSAPTDTASKELAGLKSCVSRTRGGNAYSLCCWLQNSSRTSLGLQEDLELVLRNIESELLNDGLGWENVLYIHLYIHDMDDFALSNETYVKFITQEKCPAGVPSRSTVQLPLLQVGLGHAYVEVLVAQDQSKRVLHVQSISCWAPSCIGPYSQATCHKEILHMAGQLGLDPATMSLINGGPIAELKLALENCDAVARCFNCSICSSAIQLVFYCSTDTPLAERTKLTEKQNTFLTEMKEHVPKLLEPNFLYVLVPGLPKRASVEVKPVLYIQQEMELGASGFEQNQFGTKALDHWGENCLQKCVVPGKLCAVIVHISNEFASELCPESRSAVLNGDPCQKPAGDEWMERIAKFCIDLVDRVLKENKFLWEDVMNMRVYYPMRVGVSFEALSGVFSGALDELGEMSGREEAVFNLVPVVGAGRSSASLDDVITCEVIACKE